MVVADPDGFLLTVCANGYGKRTPFGPNTALLSEEVEARPPRRRRRGGRGGGRAGRARRATARARATRAKSSMSYRKQRRGGKGVRDVRTSDRNGPVVAVTAVATATT